METVDQYLAAIAGALNENGNETALTLCCEAGQRYGEHVVLLHLHAVALRRSNRIAEAIDKMIRLFTLNPGIPGARENFTLMLAGALRAAATEQKAEEEIFLAACYRAIEAHFVLGARIFGEEIIFKVFHLLLWRSRISWVDNVIDWMKNDPHCSGELICKSVIAKMDIGLINDDLVHLAAEKGMRSIRQGKRGSFAIFSVLFYIYWKNDFNQLSRFIKLFYNDIKYYNSVESTFYQWHVTRVSRNFFENNVCNIEEDIDFISHHIGISDSQNVMLLSCDDGYWLKCAVFLLSDLLAEQDSFAVHINVVNPSPETMAQIRALSSDHRQLGYSFFTTDAQAFCNIEHQSLMRSFYACSRFLILPDVMKWYGKKIIILDVDMRLKQPMKRFLRDFAQHFDHDVGVNDGGRLGPGREFVCNLSVFSRQKVAIEFADLLKKYIIYFIKYDVPYWMIDQAAFFSVYHFMAGNLQEISIFLFGNKTISCQDYFFHAAGMGVDKQETLQRFIRD